MRSPCVPPAPFLRLKLPHRRAFVSDTLESMTRESAVTMCLFSWCQAVQETEFFVEDWGDGAGADNGNSALVEASKRAQTAFGPIKTNFANAGYPSAPLIVFWNLRSSESKPVLKDTPGVLLLSGFSAGLMVFFGGRSNRVHPRGADSRAAGTQGVPGAGGCCW